MSRGKINFGIMLHGAGGHMNAWRHPSGPADASVSIRHTAELAKAAEAAGIAFVFVADGLYINEKSIPHFLNRFEPLTVLSTLAAQTERIGLCGTVSTSYSDPFTTARQFASLDLLSGGRAGWNVVTTPLEGTARNFGRPHPEHSLRYEIADEYLKVVQGLWSSWEEDAFPRDRQSGTFFDAHKMHRLNHQGRFFTVEGPLNIQRSPQGEPVIFQAGASDTGIAFAARNADAVFTHITSFEENQTFYKQVKNNALAYGRDPDSVKIFPGLNPIVGETTARAEEKYHAIRDLVGISDALVYLGRYFDHHDFSVYPLDQPFPELGDVGKNSFRSTTDKIKREAAEKGWTLRQTALETATPRSPFIGTPDQVTDALIHYFDSGAADGFILTFAVAAQGFADFTKEILPRLEKRGYFAPNLKAATLRENLGLTIPRNRYVQQRQAENRQGVA